MNFFSVFSTFFIVNYIGDTLLGTYPTLLMELAPDLLAMAPSSGGLEFLIGLNVLYFLVRAFRRKTQTIVVTFLFFKKLRSDRFHKLYELASINCHTNVTSTASNFLRIFEVCQAEGRGFESRPLPKIFCAYYFGFVRLFCNFFKCLQRIPPFIFFSILPKNGCSKNPRGPPPFTFFGTMRLTGDFKKNRKTISENFFLMRVL